MKIVCITLEVTLVYRRRNTDTFSKIKREVKIGFESVCIYFLKSVFFKTQQLRVNDIGNNRNFAIKHINLPHREKAIGLEIVNYNFNNQLKNFLTPVN